MFGISSSGKASIAKIVEDIFDRIALQFIGDIPALKGKKMLVISAQPNFGLSNLFVQAMANQTPNAIEKDVLKSLLESSHGYIESLKNKTKSNVTERIDGLAREARIKGQKIDESEVQSAIDEELSKAKSHLQAVVESESTKLRNLGSMMQISRIAASLDDEDPNVCFIIVRDGQTCKECLKLHLMEDGSTPRVWRFSQLKQGYHKRGEENPSAFGLHPHCRCTLTYISKGFGFDKTGRLKYISENHDQHLSQK